MRCTWWGSVAISGAVNWVKKAGVSTQRCGEGCAQSPNSITCPICSAVTRNDLASVLPCVACVRRKVTPKPTITKSIKTALNASLAEVLSALAAHCPAWVGCAISDPDKVTSVPVFIIDH